jgi:hypothetical protein
LSLLRLTCGRASAEPRDGIVERLSVLEGGERPSVAIAHGVGVGSLGLPIMTREANAAMWSCTTPGKASSILTAMQLGSNDPEMGADAPLFVLERFHD